MCGGDGEEPDRPPSRDGQPGKGRLQVCPLCVAWRLYLAMDDSHVALEVLLCHGQFCGECYLVVTMPQLAGNAQSLRAEHAEIGLCCFRCRPFQASAWFLFFHTNT